MRKKLGEWLAKSRRHKYWAGAITVGGVAVVLMAVFQFLLDNPVLIDAWPGWVESALELLPIGLILVCLALFVLALVLPEPSEVMRHWGQYVAENGDRFRTYPGVSGPEAVPIDDEGAKLRFGRQQGSLAMSAQGHLVASLNERRLVVSAIDRVTGEARPWRTVQVKDLPSDAVLLAIAQRGPDDAELVIAGGGQAKAGKLAGLGEGWNEWRATIDLPEGEGKVKAAAFVDRMVLCFTEDPRAYTSPDFRELCGNDHGDGPRPVRRLLREALKNLPQEQIAALDVAVVGTVAYVSFLFENGQLYVLRTSDGTFAGVDGIPSGSQFAVLQRVLGFSLGTPDAVVAKGTKVTVLSLDTAMPTR